MQSCVLCMGVLWSFFLHFIAPMSDIVRESKETWEKSKFFNSYGTHPHKIKQTPADWSALFTFTSTTPICGTQYKL